MARRDHFHAIQRQFYRSRRFKNPYFQREHKRRVPKAFLLSIAGVLLVLGSVAYLLASPKFALTQVTVEGTQTIPSEEVVRVAHTYLEQPAWLFFHRANRFLFTSSELDQQLRSHFAFETLSIETQKNAILISVQEKQSHLLWKSEGNIFLVARDGILIRELSSAERTVLETPEEPPPVEGGEPASIPVQDPLKRLPVFVDLTNTPVEIGKPVLVAQEVEGIFRFHERLTALGIIFVETRLDRQVGKWVSVMTDVGYAILIDPTFDTDQQATNLETILRESVSDPTTLEYIDLRFDDHIYYKTR